MGTARDGYRAQINGQHRDGRSAGVETTQRWHSTGWAQHRDGHSARMDEHSATRAKCRMGIAQGWMSTVQDRQRTGMDGGTVRGGHSIGLSQRRDGWAQHRDGQNAGMGTAQGCLWRDTAGHRAGMGTAWGWKKCRDRHSARKDGYRAGVDGHSTARAKCRDGQSKRMDGYSTGMDTAQGWMDTAQLDSPAALCTALLCWDPACCQGSSQKH